MQLFYTDIFVLPLPDGHRFPMEKYSRLRETLLASGEFSASDFYLPHAATDEELAHAHDRAYIEEVCCGQLPEKAQKAIGFPWSEGMVERSRRSAGATMLAVQRSLMASRPIWRAVRTMPSRGAVKDFAFSTMLPLLLVPCRAKAEPGAS